MKGICLVVEFSFKNDVKLNNLVLIRLQIEDVMFKKYWNLCSMEGLEYVVVGVQREVFFQRGIDMKRFVVIFSWFLLCNILIQNLVV